MHTERRKSNLKKKKKELNVIMYKNLQKMINFDYITKEE